MNLFDVIILGIVEGITEFLPISSTAHLILTSKLLGIPDSNFLTSFEIAIQLGAIFSIIFIYWKTLTGNWDAVKKILVAFVPSAIVGLFLYELIKKYLLISASVSLWALMIGGIFIIFFEKFHKNKKVGAENLSYRKAIVIGLCQSLAVIPGVSRAAATIIGGLWLGIERKTIVEFSFLLAVPTMLAATALDLYKTAPSFSGEQFYLLAVGFIVSFLIAMLSVSWLLKFIRRNTFASFGVYRILLAFILWLFFFR